MNEVQFGLCAGKIIYAALRRLVGARHADRLLTGAGLISTEQALSSGLVDAIADPDRVILEAQEYATQLTRLPPQAFKATRHIARADLVRLFDGSARQDATTEMAEAILSSEAQAAIKAWAARVAT
jgi:enoyl-CoA hydratase/carnithine racemase